MNNPTLTAFVEDALQSNQLDKALAAVSEVPAVDIAEVIAQIPPAIDLIQ